MSGFLIERLRAMPGLVVGDNQPYSGELIGDCLYRHGTRNGLPHVLIEIRQDLISAAEGQAEWAARLAALVVEAAAQPHMREIRYFGSRTD